MSDLLSQNEIDALLHGVDDPAPEAEEETNSDYELYDLTSGIHRVQGWLQDIKIVDERIQSNLSISLLGMLHTSVEVKRQDVQITKYGEYVKSLYVPTSINTFMLDGLPGYTGIVLDAKLVYALVNIFFGGGSRPTQIEGREFTQTEQRVINLVLKTIIEAIKNGWKEISDVNFNLVETEMNPAHISGYSSTDVLMIRPFRIEFSGGGGEMQLLMPGSAVDSIFRNRNINMNLGGMTPQENMRARAEHYMTDVTGELSGANLTVGELFKLTKGDVISVDSPEQVDVKINGVAKFKAKMGEVNGKVGLKVLP